MFPLIRWLLVAFAAAATAAPEAATAQIVIRRGAGLVVRAPYAPPISLGVRGVIPGVPLVRPYLLPRRRALAAAAVGAAAPSQTPAGPNAGPFSEAPRFTPGATTATVAGRPTTPPAGNFQPFMTRDELASLDDGSLLNAVLEATSRLDGDLGRFNTGAGWQKFLRLPDDALPPPTADGQVTLGFNSIKTTLERLNSVQANPNYAMISRLPSFAATQLALAEVIARFSSTTGDSHATSTPATSTPTSTSAGEAEELPTPPPTHAAPANDSGGERSVLSH